MALIALSMMLAGLQTAPALTLYVKRAVVSEQGIVKVADVVQASGELSAEARGCLDQAVGSVSDGLLVVPSGLYRGEFEKRTGGNLIVVGSRTLVAGKGSSAEKDLPLLDRLVDSLNPEGFGGGAAEISVVQLQKPAASIPVSRLQFDPVRVEKRGALYSGAAEFTIRDSASESGVSIGRVIIRVTQDTAAAASQVTAAADAAPLSGDGSTEGYVISANDPVTVVFRRGAIAIEMPGKAQGSASLGRTVSVYIPESRLTFTGIVTGNKAVTVDIQ